MIGVDERLRGVVRAAYNNARLRQLDDGQAFAEAVEMFLRHRPLLQRRDAERQVRRMLREEV
jgi:hypothetical protein